MTNLIDRLAEMRQHADWQDIDNGAFVDEFRSLLATVEAVVAFASDIASDCITDLPCQECATRIELRRVVERALVVSDE